jgi:8-oxo-dGTP pyrophosphatase MutT (NUDIX family)
MAPKSPRLATRALILQENKLLLVNAFPGGRSDLWCAPGGGVESGTSLHENLMREVYEETGLRIAVGVPALINEFHDPATGFHQVDIFFRCTVTGGSLSTRWRDPAHVVTEREFFAQSDLTAHRIRFKPDSLAHAPWEEGVTYDALERLIR